VGTIRVSVGNGRFDEAPEKRKGASGPPHGFAGSFNKVEVEAYGASTLTKFEEMSSAFQGFYGTLNGSPWLGWNSVARGVVLAIR
jgi:hypothetical protein